MAMHIVPSKSALSAYSVKFPKQVRLYLNTHQNCFYPSFEHDYHLVVEPIAYPSRARKYELADLAIWLRIIYYNICNIITIPDIINVVRTSIFILAAVITALRTPRSSTVSHCYLNR